MPKRSADFIIVRRSGFTLRPGRDIDRDFDVTVPDESVGEPCVLAFILDTRFRRTGDFASLRVRVNEMARIHTISIDLLTSLHQIFPGSFRHEGRRHELLRTGPRANTIEFRIVEGEGALTIAQVFLWVRFPTST
jgi:hypothetical protein